MARFLIHIIGWLIYETPSSFAGGLPRILGGLHFPVLVIWEHIVLRALRRAGAEQEGEEEEGH